MAETDNKDEKLDEVRKLESLPVIRRDEIPEGFYTPDEWDDAGFSVVGSPAFLVLTYAGKTIRYYGESACVEKKGRLAEQARELRSFALRRMGGQAYQRFAKRMQAQAETKKSDKRTSGTDSGE